MNYPESQLIFEEIKKAKRILLNCHRSPDPDIVGSALSMYLILQNLGKENISIISPDEVPNNCRFLPNSDLIKKEDFDKFDFTKYDLMIFLDSGNWGQVTGQERIISSNIKRIVIDHHYTNPNYGDINIVDSNAGSCCNVLYKLSKDLEISFDAQLSTTILTGIIADTLSFQTDIIGDSSFSIADELIKSGADRQNIIFNLYMARSLDEIRLMGEMLENARVDETGFAWVAISKDVSKKYPKSYDAKSYVAGSFIQSIENTKFGFVLEEKDEYSTVSFRSRKSFDVSKIAEELGGGGHKSASACRVFLPFKEATEKVLEVCRKYAKKD